MTDADDPGRGRRAPWIEGACLALVVLAVLALGGDAVRASYHGYLHATIGESVLRDGLTPENPYHAGTPLRYYTLYPFLGVLLGRLGFGPLWGFALLNVLAALLLPPALDALGRSLDLPFRARRACFVAAVLGFNGLGWVGLALAPEAGFGAPPVFTLSPMTFASESFGWDPRLQGFLTKFLNVSSFPLALPFALWTLACFVRPRPGRAVLPAALALAINPLVGGFAGLCALALLAPELARATWTRRIQWLGAGIAAVALALPFLLPGLQPAPDGPLLTGEVAVARDTWRNLVGPLLLLLVPGMLGVAAMGAGSRWRWCALAGFAAAVVLTNELPRTEDFELLPLRGVLYKFARIHALLWAIPAGVWAARARRLSPVLALLCVPTVVVVPWAYLAWAAGGGEQPLRLEGGRMAVKPASGPSLFAAEAEADPRAVVVMPFAWPGAAVAPGLVQGHPVAAALHHPLFVDLPQTHNERLPDLEERLVLLDTASVASIRAKVPDRPTLWFVDGRTGGLPRALAAAGAQELAREGPLELRALPPLPR